MENVIMDRAAKNTQAQPPAALRPARAPRPRATIKSAARPAPGSEYSFGGMRRSDLAHLGAMLDQRPPMLGGRTVAMAAAEDLLRVRSRGGAAVPLIANPVQLLFE